MASKSHREDSRWRLSPLGRIQDGVGDVILNPHLPHLVVRAFVIVLQEASKKKTTLLGKSRLKKVKKKSLVTYVPWSKVQQGFLRSNSEK